MIVLLGGEDRPREFQKEFHPGCLIGADDAIGEAELNLKALYDKVRLASSR